MDELLANIRALIRLLTGDEKPPEPGPNIRRLIDNYPTKDNTRQ